ncbi:MAG: esterase [Sphingomonas sp.]|nr:esterase [Sphingomonas sp.]|tara:strand:- start:1288 stop:2118 length:831 start_codon:yes stop_codon:yes gene_type:complete
MKTIEEIGTDLGPDVLAACEALFAEAQTALAARFAPVASDQPYGPDARHRLDLYGAPESPAPIVLFVHGGGFRVGDKAADGWPNGAVGRWAAQQGFLGAVMNYRLAPAHTWPAGGEDVLAAVDWLMANAADFGGDPNRIVLVGTSAGAVHVATALQLRPDVAVRGCVLLSGLYGYAEYEDRDSIYYGDAALASERMPHDAVAATRLPLFVACAEFDPPRFQREWTGLLNDRLARHGQLPHCHYASGHNHYSMAMHIGTADRRLADEISRFVELCCA